MERAAERVDQGLRKKAAAMVQAWRAEYGHFLQVEEVIGLSREIRTGNLEALAAWETIRVEEEAYIPQRARVWRVASSD